MKPGDVIYVRKWAIGNPRATRVRVDSVSAREQRKYRSGEPTGETYTIWTVKGVEVVKSDFSPRSYFGRRQSLWVAYLEADDFDIIGRAT